MISNLSIGKIKLPKKEFQQLKPGKESLQKFIAEAEVPELVYKSNAIEN